MIDVVNCTVAIDVCHEAALVVTQQIFPGLLGKLIGSLPNPQRNTAELQ